MESSTPAPQATSYDLMPYAVYNFAVTHPDRLSTVARMCGMKPASVENCRVLELGCASGGNIIPMADALPRSSFVGLDLSARQIDDGNAMVSELKLSNIQLLQKDLLDLDSSLGKFDYIIAHGVYSWVPDKVRDKVVEICSNNLADNGVAYISYNTFPGWGLRTMIRDMMRYHIRKIDDPKQQVAQARALLNFLAQSTPAANAHYAALLKDEVELIRNDSDAYLFHDHLEEVNQPCYFHEFIDHASAHGLQFLAEAEPRSALGRDLSPEVREKVRPLGGTIEREQYLDFLRNRGFRQTLLCHKNIDLQRTYNADLLRGLYVVSSFKPKEPLNPGSAAPWTFVNSKGNDITTSSPVARALLAALADAHPRRILFDDLILSVQSGEPAVPPADIAEVLWELYLYSAVSFFTRQIDFASVVSARPTVRPLSRLQARQSASTANFLHATVNLNPIARAILPLIDGTRDRDQLLDEFCGLEEQGAFELEPELRAIPTAQRRPVYAKSLDDALQKIAAAALLVA